MRKKDVGRKVMWVLKSLLASYIITGILLLILAFLVYKFELDEQVVVGGIVSIYIISTFMGGFIIGKLTEVTAIVPRETGCLWGMIIGTIYVLLLLAISYGIYREFNTNGLNTISTIILCVGGGTLGGMLA